MEALILTRPISDNNPISLLLRHARRGGQVVPPVGFQLLTDEQQRLLRDERGAYLIDREEDNNNG